MKEYFITPESKIRLDELLRQQLPSLMNAEISNSKLRRLIMAGKVFVNGRQIRVPSYTVFAKSTVSAQIEEEKLFYEKQPDDISYELSEKDVLYEDDVIIVVNKPSHFPTESTIVESRDNLHKALIRYLFEKQKIEHPNAKNPPYAGIMHRLDRDTSGVILFTKSRTVNAACHEMFEKHTARKEYVAITSFSGKINDKKDFTVEFPMGRISPKGQPAKFGKLSEEKGGLHSRTDFKILSSGSLKDCSGQILKIHCDLSTGRTHQIRVHLSSEGYPILGDELYGGKPYKRIMLHAKKLTFPHPVTGEILSVEAPLPEDFNI